MEFAYAFRERSGESLYFGSYTSSGLEIHRWMQDFHLKMILTAGLDSCAEDSTIASKLAGCSLPRHKDIAGHISEPIATRKGKPYHSSLFLKNFQPGSDGTLVNANFLSSRISGCIGIS